MKLVLALSLISDIFLSVAVWKLTKPADIQIMCAKAPEWKGKTYV